MTFFEPVDIIDISQPIDEQSAVFPGDVPFRRDITVSYADSGVINLSSFTMSPHVGTHADAPVHLKGSLSEGEGVPPVNHAGSLPLLPYIGPAFVIDLAPCHEPITQAHLPDSLKNTPLPRRLLFRTRRSLRYQVFESDYASFAPELIAYLAQQGVILLGIDTPSVDATTSKTLSAHHALIQHHMSWIENLHLQDVPQGDYFLSALPLKFTTLEATPVRAILLPTSPA